MLTLENGEILFKKTLEELNNLTTNDEIIAKHSEQMKTIHELVRKNNLKKKKTTFNITIKTKIILKTCSRGSESFVVLES